MILVLISHHNNSNILITILCSHNQVFSVIAYDIVLSFIQLTHEVVQIYIVYIVFKPLKEPCIIMKHLLLYCRENIPTWIINHAKCAHHCWPSVAAWCYTIHSAVDIQ